MDYISASQINTFLHCPLGYKLQYMDKMFEDRGNIYATFGTAVHHALASNYSQKIKSYVDLTSDEVYNTFIEKFDAESQLCELNKWDNVESMRVIGKNMLDDYMLTVAKTIQPIAVEQKFEIKLKTKPVTILGYIDLIDVDGYVIDHKTVGKSVLRTWTQKHVDNLLQMTMYAIAYRKLYGKKEAGIRIDILPRDNKPKFSSIVTQRTEEQIHSVIDLAYRIQEIKKLEVWYPNLQNCSSCMYNKVCPKIIK